MLNQLWNDEAGFVISAELVLVLTIAVLAMIVGLSEVAVAVNTELNDISNAIRATPTLASLVLAERTKATTLVLSSTTLLMTVT